MNDKVTSGISPIVCTHCGSESGSNVRQVACISESIYAGPEKDPVIPTTGDWIAQTIVHRMKDNLEIWTIALCKECQTKGYKYYLRKRMADAKPWVFGGPFAFLGLIAAILIEQRVRPEGWAEGMPLLLLILYGLLFVVGFIFFPVHAVRYIMASRDLGLLKKQGYVPPERVEDAFRGEAERVTDELETGNPKNIWGQFHLPNFKTQKEYPEEDRKKLKGLKRSERKRSILAVSETKESLIDSLPEEWRRITNDYQSLPNPNLSVKQ